MSRNFEYQTPVSKFTKPKVVSHFSQYAAPRSSRSSSSSSSSSDSSLSKKELHYRSRVVLFALYFLLFCIVGRLFYWQVMHRSVLQAQAESQYTRTIINSAHRGKILTSDGFTLVNNRVLYRMFAQPHVIKEDPIVVTEKLLGPLSEQLASEMSNLQSSGASGSGITSPQLAAVKEELRVSIQKKLENKDVKWVSLRNKVEESTKQKIESLKVWGVGFERYEARTYPEASMAAHIVGFVGKNKEGLEQGYFGIEGALDRELRGQVQKETYLKDALGFHLLFDTQTPEEQINGRDVVLTIRRDVQFAVEEILKSGMAKYGASGGEVIVMEPSTGKILALASYPNYHPEHFYDFKNTLHKNPSVADLYEPGSTFKVLTVAAGVDAGLINENTVCTKCDSARTIGQYTIKTWNDRYNPDVTIKDALAKSDNVAMIFIAEMLGEKRFKEYVNKFGIGEELHLELQEDTSTPLKKDWTHIDLATTSFGQGIATTAMQMVRAVGAIANDGKMMRPRIIEKVIDHSRGTQVEIPTQEERQVVSPEAAQAVQRMMVHAASSGEAKWTSSRTHIVAGKTGTAQIPIAGHYDKEKTIASFIGFSPAENPKFVMLVKLREPTSSPWASETAAPLWYEIADKLYLLLNVPPDM